VRRVVHISITNPDENSDLEYFRGKAQVETALAKTGINYTILRPAVIFGREDILINNIAWALRRLPIFGIFGDGRYKLQPIFVDDLAALAIECLKHEGNRTVNAIGPETFTYRELVDALGTAIGCRRRVVSVSPAIGHGVAWIMGKWAGDVIITRDEIRALMEGRLYVDTPPTGTTALTSWAMSNSGWLGRRYASELARRTDRLHGYLELRGEQE
jgi:NADH dehydrogenase